MNGNLPDLNRFEFKVYALNEKVMEYYEDRANFVGFLNPNNSDSSIPVQKGDPEPGDDGKEDQNFQRKFLRLNLFILFFGSFCYENFLNGLILLPFQDRTFQTIIAWSAAAVAVLVIIATTLISIIILYKRRVKHLNWLHRLEQFKTEHLYTAYKHLEREQRECKSATKQERKSRFVAMILGGTVCRMRIF